MTKEQIEILECSVKNLPTECWWDCNGCPKYDECNDLGEDEEAKNPPLCEEILFEAIKTLKGLAE